MATNVNSLYYTDVMDDKVFKMDYNGNNLSNSTLKSQVSLLSTQPGSEEFYYSWDWYPTFISRSSDPAVLAIPSTPPAAMTLNPASGAVYYLDEKNTVVKKKIPGVKEPETVLHDSNGIVGIVFVDGKLYYGGKTSPAIRAFDLASRQTFSVPFSSGQSWPIGYSNTPAPKDGANKGL